ncbi:MAG: glucose-1-phosphate cytidylyltransferase [Anaerolineae bacterium]|nr:glucose-1-phosphate cytidylyltransferase [Anaerolineae bacterium]
MKVAILAGGLGTRLAEETHIKPKPMVLIGERPILWHIMSIYAAHGFKEFVVALGYKGDMIKDYFINYHLMRNSLTVNLANGAATAHHECPEDWLVHLVDTGAQTQTGGRVKRLQQWVGEETFMLTYGDGVANIDLHSLLAFHKRHGKLATLTAVRMPSRFGGLSLAEERVDSFTEKPRLGEGWINGGFFVLEPGVFDYLEGDDTIFEREPLENLAQDGQLFAYRHEDYWQCMDSMRDVQLLEKQWAQGSAPWKLWN